ncbi:hypothetical protein G6011_01134 [Alternaria panax]|uniref:Uncharacterized protein n=1 Tax=Alternaria panax TaxID=48097 RepID=A0AAD4NVK0_9PLEO|nr:hypothetical protein G6011_01134 [Alternaria panax]
MRIARIVVLVTLQKTPLEPANFIAPTMISTSTHGNSDALSIETFTKFQDEKDKINNANSEIRTQLAAGDMARRELEQRLQMNEGRLVEIAAHEEHLFKGMSATEVFTLGREMERSHADKRRKLD